MAPFDVVYVSMMMRKSLEFYLGVIRVVFS